MQKIGHYKYVIVGGGISALQAAAILAQNNESFILLQAGNRIGGRICSMTLGQALQACPDKYPWLQNLKDCKMECGATWICQDHQFMLHFANKYGLSLIEQYYQGQYVIAETPQKYHQFSDSAQYYQKYSPQILHLIGQLQTLRKRFEYLWDRNKQNVISEQQVAQLDQFYSKYDNMSAFEFINGHIKDNFLCQLLAKEVSALVGCSTHSYSVLDLFDNQEEPFSSLKYYVGLQNANIDGFRLREGLSSICQGLKQQIQKAFDLQGKHRNVNDLIRLNTPVVEVRNSKSPVEVVTDEGQIYYCSKLLVNNQAQSNITRIALIFKQPFWRQKYSASVSFSHHFPMCELAQLTPANQEYGAIAFVFASDGYSKWNSQILQECKSKQGQGLAQEWYSINKRKLLKIVADMFLQGDIENTHLKEVGIFVKSLSESPYIKSTYNSFPAISTAFKINQLKQAVDPKGDQLNVVVLGSDFSDQFNGYMQGAIRIARKKVYTLCGVKDPLEHLGQVKAYKAKQV